MNLSRALSMVLLPVMLLALPGCDAAKKALDKAAGAKAGAKPPLEVKDITEDEFPAFIRQPGKVNVVIVYDIKGAENAAQTQERLTSEKLLNSIRESSDVVSVGKLDRQYCKVLGQKHTPGVLGVAVFRAGSEVEGGVPETATPIDEFARRINREAESIRKEQPAVAAVPGSNPPRELAAKDFESFTKTPQKLSVVVFHADWCGPCQKLKPVIAEVADSFPGVSEVGRFNVDNCQDLAGRLNVSGIPDVRFYRDGKEVGRFTGYRPDNAVRELFKQHTAGLKAPAPSAPSSGSSSGPGSVTRMKKDWLPPGVEKR